MEFIYQIINGQHQIRLEGGEVVKLNKEQHHIFKKLMGWDIYRMLPILQMEEIITLTTDAEDYINTFRG